MCNQAVDNYVHPLESCKTQEMCDKAVYTYPSAIQSFPECVITLGWLIQGSGGRGCEELINFFEFFPTTPGPY